MAELNCNEILRPFVDSLNVRAARDWPNVQIIGGTGSAALAANGVTIVTDEQLVIAPEGFSIPQFREDGNKRDVDVLVVSDRQHHIDVISSMLKACVGNRLKRSVFGLHQMSDLDSATRHPLWQTTRAWLSDRYVVSSGGSIVDAKKAIFPFAVNFDPSVLQTWRLQIGSDTNHTTPIPHPGATLTNYLTRSISGLRPKDEAKVLGNKKQPGIAANVLGDPELAQWVLDGPGKSLVKLAKVLHGIRQMQDVESLASLRLTELVTLKPFTLKSLENDPIFMFYTEEEQLPYRSQIILNTAHRKARMLHLAETNPTVVRLWQKGIEPFIGRIVKNK